MLVKNLVNWAGDRFSYAPGDLVEMPEDVALARIEAGLAVPHDGKPEKPVRHTHPAAPSIPTAAK